MTIHDLLFFRGNGNGRCKFYLFFYYSEVEKRQSMLVFLNTKGFFARVICINWKNIYHSLVLGNMGSSLVVAAGPSSFLCRLARWSSSWSFSRTDCHSTHSIFHPTMVFFFFSSRKKWKTSKKSFNCTTVTFPSMNGVSFLFFSIHNLKYYPPACPLTKGPATYSTLTAVILWRKFFFSLSLSPLILTIPSINSFVAAGQHKKRNIAPLTHLKTSKKIPAAKNAQFWKTHHFSLSLGNHVNVY